jgi:hypothetical protein
MPIVIYDRKSSNPRNDHDSIGTWRRDDLTTWKNNPLPEIGSTILITEFASQGAQGVATERVGDRVTDVAVFEQTYREVNGLRRGVEHRARRFWLHIWLGNRVSPVTLDPTNPWDGWEAKTDQMDRDLAANAVRATQRALRRQYTGVRNSGAPEALRLLLADLDRHLGDVVAACQTIAL